MADVTQILSQIEHGDPSASEQLLPMVYAELRKLAAARMAHEKAGQTLQATALVHEAYVRLVDAPKVQHWNSRGHFFSAAAEAMRRILIENARHKESERAGGKVQRVDLEGLDLEAPNAATPVDLIALNEALSELESCDPRKAELVKLRYFAGLSVRAAAEVLGVAPSTAIADWAYAKGWLRLRISGRES